MKRIVIMSDLHCGHTVGLTPKSFDATPPKTAIAEYQLYRLRRTYYDTYRKIINSLKPIDVVIANGDLIDGRGEKSGGTELLFSDRNKQVDMAVACLRECEAESVFIGYGTAYHSGNAEDWEDQIASKIDAKEIVSHGFLDVEGLVFDYRHHVGSSSVPYGRFTQIAKEKIWNNLWNEFDEYPNSDITIRSHVHYYGYAGRYGWLGLTTPALQGYGSKYGDRRMSGTVDWGLIHFDVENKNKWTWQAHIVKPKQSLVKPTKV